MHASGRTSLARSLTLELHGQNPPQRPLFNLVQSTYMLVHPILIRRITVSKDVGEVVLRIDQIMLHPLCRCVARTSG